MSDLKNKVDEEFEKLKAGETHEIEKAIANMHNCFDEYEKVVEKLKEIETEVNKKIDLLGEENKLLSNLLITTYDILKNNEEFVLGLPALKGLYFEYKDLFDEEKTAKEKEC